MKKLVLLLLSAIQLFCGSQALGQATFTIPQSETNNGTAIFSAVNTAQTSGCLKNEGQNIWFSNYTAGTNAIMQYRLEYSYNSDAATCTTGTWFPMSDDATDPVQGEVIGLGSYPFVRANLVAYSNGGTFTSFYSTSSASNSNLFGFYNPIQQVKKVVFQGIADNADATSGVIAAPYGSTAGLLVMFNSANTPTFSGNAKFTISGKNYGASFSNTILNTQYKPIFVEPSSPATSLTVAYNHGSTNDGIQFTLYYIFYPPGSSMPAAAQPPIVNNSEVVSNTNAAVSVSLPSSGAQTGNTQTAYIYSVNARCSAGTATLSIFDSINSTNIWSSASGEVGTTTFKYQWNPGLAFILPAGNDIVKVQLSSCGVGNTGTLDVQASIF